MVRIFLSEKALHDLAENPEEVGDRLLALSKAVSNFKALCQHQYPSIKRLKGIKPIAWRHRKDPFRTVFTTTRSSEGEETIIVHRVTRRSVVYRDLPPYFCSDQAQSTTAFIIPKEDQLFSLDFDSSEHDKHFQECDRYYKLPQKFFDHNNLDHNNAESLAQWLFGGHYLHSPVLTVDQENQTGIIHSYGQNKEFQIHRFQGGAGTGKTTYAFHLAAQFVQNYYPIIVVPNHHLKSFGQASIDAMEKDWVIRQNLSDNAPSDLAILERNNFLQTLANVPAIGHSVPAIAHAEANVLIRNHLKQAFLNRYPGEDLFAIYQGFLQHGGYPFVEGDPLCAGQRELLEEFKGELSNAWNKLDLKHELDQKGAVNQARIALSKKKEFSNKLRKITGNKTPILIIDEVQDFYWQQLQVLIEFIQSGTCLAPVVLLGDENQRVTISGFSWNALQQRLPDSFPHAWIENPLNRFDRNFRNTAKIAQAANYILLKAFPTALPPNTRVLIEPPDSNYFEEGSEPLLIEVDRPWLENLLKYLVEESEAQTANTPSKFVFILNENSKDFNWLQGELEACAIAETFTIAEAKGQEFNAVVLVSPFSHKKEKPSVDDLFKWYTAISRARCYEAILISSDEMGWLEKHTQDWNNQHYFALKSNITASDFWEELKLEGKTLITTEQRHQKFVSRLLKQIFHWSEGKACPTELIKQCEQQNLSVWKLVDKLSIEAQSWLSSASNLDKNKIVTQSFSHLTAEEATVLYAGARPLWVAFGIDVQKNDEKLVAQLRQYCQKYPDRVDAIDLDMGQNSIFRSLLFRAAGRSWDAAKAISQSQSDLDKQPFVEAIIQDLIQKGLLYEAQRIQYQFLNDSSQFPKNSPYKGSLFPEVLKNSDPLVPALCNAVLTALSSTIGN